jgi:hypothetical protein
MEGLAGQWSSVLIVLLFGFLLLLRIKFPSASRGAETTVLAFAAVLFLGLCYFIVPR